MGLFQPSILQKYLGTLDKKEITKAYKKFTAHFHDPETQDNIRSSNEEQYQEGFLIDLFVNVLGYTKNPTPKYNLTTEYKNVKDAKKADGAIIISNQVQAVIELKGTDTTDLTTVETQAFGYKNNQPDCIYIITSNFEKLRLYIDNAIEHIEFNLFTLGADDFAILYLCLSKVSLEKAIPKKLKDESVSQEDKITKQLYKDYSVFKRELFLNLVSRNPKIKPIELYKKSQKLLDRFLFLYFAEDRQLLAPNSVRSILKKWQQLKELDQDKSLYENFKEFFGHLNVGFKGKLYEVFAYNGGLFKPDDLLDNVNIDDDLLYRHTLKLSEYDFQSEVDVNILGHIFENSLTELDEIKAELEGNVVDKSKTKRKKDGVFYTPKYITKYIVDNTVGKLCAEKKAELQIHESDYFTDKKRQKGTRQVLSEKLNNYRQWLLQITICDPACGSGAFLNQSLEFLIAEHRYIDELQAKVFGDRFLLSDVENSILENNLFGVDLNEESVEIAKLSLWLRTAQPKRKLNDLSGNIKCGNSIIPDKHVAGEKAFIWKKEFPAIFEKGGFDVVIGNPPYGASLTQTEKDYIRSKYTSMEGEFDTYIYFLEASFNIGKPKAECGFIVPNNLLQQKFGRKIREMLLKDATLEVIIDLGLGIFDDAVVPTTIVHYKLEKEKKENIVKCLYRPTLNNFHSDFIEINSKDFVKNENFSFNIQLNKGDKKLIEKLDDGSKKLKEICELKIGIEATPNFIHDVPTGAFSKPMVRGRNFNRYSMDFESDPKYIEYERHKLHRPREERLFDCPKKIVIRQTGDRVIASIDTQRLYAWKSVFVILTDEKIISQEYLLTLLNSSVINYYYQKIVGEAGRVFAQVKGVNLDKLPIKLIPLKQQKPFIEKAELMLKLNKEADAISSKFKRTLERKFSLTEFPKKIQDWHNASYGDLVSELGKLKIKMSVSDEAEWEEYFLKEQAKARDILSKIYYTNKEIDQMVYALYKLTPTEIKLIEE